MKKAATLILLILAFAIQQTSAQMTFKEAKKLNDCKEYRKAVSAFASLQEEALAAGDTCLYMDCLLAEGEVAYMLDWTTTMYNVLEKASEIFWDSSIPEENDSIDLAWKQAILKLEGSYYYCMTDIDENAYYYSEQAYLRSLEYIDSLENKTRTDNPYLRPTIWRELLSLYYKYAAYEPALVMADTLYDHWTTIYNEEKFIDACISKAMVLAHLNRFDEATECIDEIYEDVRKTQPRLERTKGKIELMRHDHDGSGDIELAKKCYKRYTDYIKKEIDSQVESMTPLQREQYWLEMNRFATDCYRLGNHAPDQLYDIALYSKGYIIKFNSNDKREYKWKDIRNVLKNNECAIEFVQHKGKDEKEYLGALLLKQQFKKPHYIEIGRIDEIAETYTLDGYTIGECMANDAGIFKNALYSDSTIYPLIWTDELLTAIGEAEKVYFSPDGIIHQLAIEYMQPDERFESIRLSSTRTLLSHKKVEQGNMLLYGGIEYYAYIEQHKEENDVEGYLMLHETSDYINYLPGTQKETVAIYNLRRESYPGDTILLGSTATDDNLTKLANSGYSILHISTHGYFTGNLSDTYIKPAVTDNALSRSGIILAGAGKNLADNSFDPQLSDGILTAKEISEQDLSNVGLVVLSACQTGLGYITSDGVYGMQRALKQAGVSSMILSLWSVDDNATNIFMQKFYEELKKDQSKTPNIRKAFMNARKQLIEGETTSSRFNTSTLSWRKRSIKYDEPQFINAFILIDAI